MVSLTLGVDSSPTFVGLQSVWLCHPPFNLAVEIWHCVLRKTGLEKKKTICLYGQVHCTQLNERKIRCQIQLKAMIMGLCLKHRRWTRKHTFTINYKHPWITFQNIVPWITTEKEASYPQYACCAMEDLKWYYIFINHQYIISSKNISLKHNRVWKTFLNKNTP